jgi:uncharacterized protein involved in cysteine biosynthesis
MALLPCALCGYDAPLEHCALCGGRANDVSLLAPRVRGLAAVRCGAAAPFQGLRLIASTRGAKRWLVPPLLLTAAVFGLCSWWLWQQMDPWIEHMRKGVDALPVDASWMAKLVAWLLKFKGMALLAHLGSALTVLLAVSLAALWVFSIVYEAVSGPFLDQVHGRVEQRWFGHDPRATLDRPSSLPARQCVELTLLAVGPALLLACFALRSRGVGLGILAALTPLPPLLVARRWPEWARWASWFVRVEAGTAWVSIKASILAGTLLVLCLPLKFLPFLGLPLFWLIAGFTTAVSLIDIAMERRRWSLAMRWRFLRLHWPAFTAFGLVAGAFFLVPIAGAVLMVPAASVGSLWLVCRLEKGALRRPAT